jgi:hypothetical protein
MIDAMGSSGAHRGCRRDHRRRRIMRNFVVFVAAALALGLGITGVYALSGGPSSSGMGPGLAVTSAPTPPSATASVTSPAPLVTPRPSSTAQSTPDPTALADGIYPAYVRAVDVQRATITVDVVQVFVGGAAHQAAIEDGVAWQNVRFDPVYIRNENPLLRALPVAREVNIKFIGVCMEPNRRVGLTELRKEITPFTTTFYYDVSVVGGTIERIQQLIAVAAC